MQPNFKGSGALGVAGAVCAVRVVSIMSVLLSERITSISVKD